MGIVGQAGPSSPHPVADEVLVLGEPVAALTSTNAIIYDHYLVTISCLVIEVLFAVTKKYLVTEDYSFYDDIQIWS
jgi:hypothetical protein